MKRNKVWDPNCSIIFWPNKILTYSIIAKGPHIKDFYFFCFSLQIKFSFFGVNAKKQGRRFIEDRGFQCDFVTHPFFFIFHRVIIFRCERWKWPLTNIPLTISSVQVFDFTHIKSNKEYNLSFSWRDKIKHSWSKRS